MTSNPEQTGLTFNLGSSCLCARLRNSVTVPSGNNQEPIRPSRWQLQPVPIAHLSRA